MMEITISGQDKKSMKRIEELAEELGLRISKSPIIDKKENNGKKLYELMEEMASTGAFSNIEDPVAWQKEQRKDRPLPGRD